MKSLTLAIEDMAKCSNFNYLSLYVGVNIVCLPMNRRTTVRAMTP